MYKKKINEKLNSHKEQQYETLVHKTIILNLEKEIEFLRNKIISKNEIIENLLRLNTQKDNIDQNAWNIKDTSDTSSCKICSSKDC